MKRWSPTSRKKRSARAGILVRTDRAGVPAAHRPRALLERRRPRGRRLRPIPRAKAAFERLVVVAAAKPLGQAVEQPHVAAAKDDVFGGAGGAQQLGAFEHDLAATRLRRAPSGRAGRAGPRRSGPCRESARARARRRGLRPPARCRGRSRGRGTACGRPHRCRAPAWRRRS